MAQPFAVVAPAIRGKVKGMAGELDWTAVREALRAARLEAGLDEKDLAEQGVSSLSNVYRIENVTDNPKQRPDLETMAKWLAVTTGESVGKFLTRLEKAPEADVRKTYPVTVESDTVPFAPPPLQPGEAASGHGSAVISGFGVSAAQDAYLLKSLAFTIVRAANALRDHGEVRSDDAGAPEGRDEPTDRRGSDDAPGLSRVK